MKRRLLLTVAAVLLCGCVTGKRATVGDRPSPQGVWAAGGWLVRGYDGLSMRSAFDAVEQLGVQRSGQFDDKDFGKHHSDFEIEMPHGDDAEVQIWAPSDGGVTEIGVLYDGDDPEAQAAEFLDAVEKILGNPRRVH